MSGDPALAKFAAIQFARLSGVVLILVGLLVNADRLPALTGLPDAAASVMIGVGLVDFFVLPILLARRWRTPPQ